MKRYKILLGACLLFSLSACEDYLDQVPDEKLTEENLFDSKDDAVKVLTQVYSYYENPIEFSSYIGQSADAVDFNWSNYGPHKKDQGEVGPGSPIFDHWSGYYNSIRTSINFINRIDECQDEKLSDQERTWWKGEAFFLQAYYNFLLLQQYGPVPIIDKIYQGDELTAAMEKGIGRSSMDKVVTHIDSLLVEAAKRLDVTYSIPDRAGRANASAAWFLRSRLWLYAASPLYNGMVNPTTGKSYAHLMIEDAEGAALLNSSIDVEKWKKAKDYAEQAIETANGGGYDIFMGDGSDYTPGITAYKRLFSYPRGGEPSIEWVFYKQNFGTGSFINHTLPISWSGYSGICPTWEHVNEYFMANGLMPEDDQEYQNATGFYTYEKDGFNPKVYNKFRKRDPRFYANILFPEQYSYAMTDGNTESISNKWAGETNKNLVYFRPYVDGQDGFDNKTGRDYCNTGFLSVKYVASSATKSNHGDYAAPVFRYTELFLNYMEAAFEYDVAKGIDPLGNAALFDKWDKIRDRIGMAHVKDAYQDAGIALTVDKLRELLHRERRIELAFEGHRYFDNRRWLDAEREGGDKHGLNIMKKDGEGFWTEDHVMESRYWDDKLYFMPISQDELDKNPLLTQNPRW